MDCRRFTSACDGLINRINRYCCTQDDHAMATKLKVYLKYVVATECRVDHVIVGQNPYKSSVCHELSASALAYSCTLDKPTVSVANLVSAVLSYEEKKTILARSDVSARRKELVSMLRESHMMALSGVLMLNCMYVSLDDKVSTMRQSMDVVAFIRDVIMCRTSLAPKFQVYTLGTVPTQAVNKLASYVKGVPELDVSFAACANPASRQTPVFDSTLMGLVSSIDRMAKAADECKAAINELAGQMQSRT